MEIKSVTETLPFILLSGTAERKKRRKSSDLQRFALLYKRIRREDGIRTHDTLVEYTHFPGVRLRPLGHLSNLSECK